MKRQDLSKILVPVDGSEPSFAAVSFAIEIAKKFGAQLKILHVVAINQSMRAVGLYGTSYPDVVAKHISEAKKEADLWFDRILREAEAAGITTTSEIIDTPISVVGEIVDYAEKNNFGMIVIGTKGKSGFEKLLLGSVATGVMTYASCPVLVVR